MTDTFILLYILYKLGCASTIVAIVMLVATVVQLATQSIISVGTETFPVRITITILLMLLGLVVGLVTPSYTEIKAWTYYTITKSTADKEKAKNLIQAAFDYIDGKAK